MGVRFLDDDARRAFKHAVETIEGASAVEVVIAVRRRSAAYRHANVVVGAALAFAGLATMLYSAHPFALSSILVDPFVVALLGAAAVDVLPEVKRALTSASVRRRHVGRAARGFFVDHGVHNTTGRSGLLVYISWLERQVALVPDSGLAHAVADGVLPRAEAELAAAMPRGGAAVARVLEALAPELARAMPHRADDINELPDDIDSDLAEPRP